jgi:hypothetical protein
VVTADPIYPIYAENCAIADVFRAAHHPHLWRRDDAGRPGTWRFVDYSDPSQPGTYWCDGDEGGALRRS